ncbi:MAG: hypothetical protein H6627_09020 [Calditrichae bacterium]|nr:hypothetical protein [Calditrichota bacterium]MCB9058695.1 hypothetical protein [Calditrichia bacterium]
MRSLFIIFISTFSLFAQDKHYYFYNPDARIGSEYYFNPLNMILNGSYDILRNGAHSKSFTEINYEKGMNNVWWNISHPLKAIDQYGWKYFLSEEVFPVSIRKDEAQYFPNYFHHAIGGGMLYVKTAEWYDYHNFPYPKTAAFLSSSIYQFLNESIENDSYQGVNTDPIADLLIFNPLGYILFEFDVVKEFFSKTAPLHDWSLQPIIDPRNNFMENAGQQFVLKYDPGFFENYSFFWYWGISGIAGLTYSQDKKHNYSFGAGQVVNKLKENVRRHSRLVTPELDGALGFFYDIDNSLVASMIVTGPGLYNARVNIYPGYWDLGFLSPGFYLGFGEWDKFIAGISFVHIPVGLGIAK